MSEIKLYETRKTASNNRGALAKLYPSAILELAPEGDKFIIVCKRNEALANFVAFGLEGKGVKIIEPVSMASKLAAAQEKIAKVFAEADAGPTTEELQAASDGAIAAASKEADMATREKTGRKLKTTAERKERKATSERRPRAVRTDGAGKGSTDYTAEGLFARGAEARKRLADGLSPFREGSKKQLAFEALREGMTMEQLKKHLSWTNTGTIQTQLWEIAKALGKERAHDKETGIYSFK